MTPLRLILLTATSLTTLTACHPASPPPSTRHTHALSIATEAIQLSDSPPTPASLLAAADRTSASAVDTINAIRAARALILRDLRNADTTGYKSSRAAVPAGGPATLQLDMTQGPLESTGRSLDLAIDGPGFLKIKMPDYVADGIGYTRNGSLFVNNQNELVVGAGDGYKLVPPVTIPPGATSISISRDGIVECIRPGQDTKTLVAHLMLSQFQNPQCLSPVADSIYTPTDTSGPPLDSHPGDNGAGTLLQGYLESSNVDLLRARLRLQFLQRWESTLLSTIESNDRSH